MRLLTHYVWHFNSMFVFAEICKAAWSKKGTNEGE